MNLNQPYQTSAFRPPPGAGQEHRVPTQYRSSATLTRAAKGIDLRYEHRVRPLAYLQELARRLSIDLNNPDHTVRDAAAQFKGSFNWLERARWLHASASSESRQTAEWIHAEFYEPYGYERDPSLQLRPLLLRELEAGPIPATVQALRGIHLRKEQPAKPHAPNGNATNGSASGHSATDAAPDQTNEPTSRRRDAGALESTLLVDGRAAWLLVRAVQENDAGAVVPGTPQVPMWLELSALGHEIECRSDATQTAEAFTQLAVRERNDPAFCWPRTASTSSLTECLPVSSSDPRVLYLAGLEPIEGRGFSLRLIDAILSLRNVMVRNARPAKVDSDADAKELDISMQMRHRLAAQWLWNYAPLSRRLRYTEGSVDTAALSHCIALLDLRAESEQRQRSALTPESWATRVTRVGKQLQPVFDAMHQIQHPPTRKRAGKNAATDAPASESADAAPRAPHRGRTRGASAEERESMQMEQRLIEGVHEILRGESPSEKLGHAMCALAGNRIGIAASNRAGPDGHDAGGVGARPALLRRVLGIIGDAVDLRRVLVTRAAGAARHGVAQPSVPMPSPLWAKGLPTKHAFELCRFIAQRSGPNATARAESEGGRHQAVAAAMLRLASGLRFVTGGEGTAIDGAIRLATSGTISGTASGTACEPDHGAVDILARLTPKDVAQFVRVTRTVTGESAGDRAGDGARQAEAYALDGVFGPEVAGALAWQLVDRCPERADDLLPWLATRGRARASRGQETQPARSDGPLRGWALLWRANELRAASRNTKAHGRATDPRHAQRVTELPPQSLARLSPKVKRAYLEAYLTRHRSLASQIAQNTTGQPIGGSR